LPHNFIANVWAESGNEEVESDVIVAVLDSKGYEVVSNLSTDGNGCGDNLRQGTHNRAKGVGRDSLLVKLFEGGHVVDGVSDPDVIIDYTF
jgi:hypothetical protein